MDIKGSFKDLEDIVRRAYIKQFYPNLDVFQRNISLQKDKAISNSLGLELLPGYSILSYVGYALRKNTYDSLAVKITTVSLAFSVGVIVESIKIGVYYLLYKRFRN